MSGIPRSLLAQAFPDNPRLRAAFEAELSLLDAITAQADTLKQQLADLALSIGAGLYQPESDLLTGLADLPSRAGAIVLNNGGVPDIRPIDSSDAASLISRGAIGAYFASLGNYASDAAAATGGVAVGQPYRNGSAICVRIA